MLGNSGDGASRTPRFWEPLIAIAVAIGALALTGCSNPEKEEVVAFAETKPECMPTAVPNSFIVHWKDGSVTVERGITRKDFEREVFEPNKSAIRLAEQDQIVSAGPMQRPGDVIVQAPAQTAPTEAELEWGQTMTSVSSAWTAGVRGAGVTVAVIDSGVDISHPQLRSQLAINTGEIANNGVDDDENGLIDDVSGWDFFVGSHEVGDTAGHGTHVAGIILADQSAGPIKGVAPAAKLLPLDFMNSDGEGRMSDAIMAIRYAVARGARVINASWGGTMCSSTLRSTIDDLRGKGVLFIAAAGNSGVDLDQSPEYPAAFAGPAQITVGASTQRDFIAGFSNFSFSLVSLFAPGTAIYSTYPGGRIAALSGTSMATPFVAGAAALLFSAKPSATADEVRSSLLSSVDHGNFAATSRGRLNIAHALEKLQAGR